MSLRSREAQCTPKLLGVLLEGAFMISDFPVREQLASSLPPLLTVEWALWCRHCSEKGSMEDAGPLLTVS